MKKTLYCPPFLEIVWKTINKAVTDPQKDMISSFYITTARGTGKTTTIIKLLCYYALKYKLLINIIKKTEAKLEEIFEQIISTFLTDFGIEARYHHKRRRLEINNTVFRGYTLNKEHMKQKEVPTGLAILLDKELVINWSDEVAPDIDHSLLAIFEQSQKTSSERFVPKINIYSSNPWVKANYFVSKWFKGSLWNRNLATTKPYYVNKIEKDICYIAASIYANPKCPESDFKTYWDTTEHSQAQRDIVIYGLPGADNGQVFDAFYKMSYVDFKQDFMRYVVGIDIGWTNVSSNGGATVMEVFKFSDKYGISGVLEYYHHNKTKYIDSVTQQTYMLTKLHDYLKKNVADPNRCLVEVKIDGGTDSSINKYFEKEWREKFQEDIQHTVIFITVNTGAKRTWRLKDRYDWINAMLALNKIHVEYKLQPHLYSDLESAVYKDTTIGIEKDPTLEHQFSDTVMALCYSVIGKHNIWGKAWREFEKRKNKWANHQQLTYSLEQTKEETFPLTNE